MKENIISTDCGAMMLITYSDLISVSQSERTGHFLFVKLNYTLAVSFCIIFCWKADGTRTSMTYLSQVAIN